MENKRPYNLDEQALEQDFYNIISESLIKKSCSELIEHIQLLHNPEHLVNYYISILEDKIEDDILTQIFKDDEDARTYNEAIYWSSGDSPAERIGCSVEAFNSSSHISKYLSLLIHMFNAVPDKTFYKVRLLEMLTNSLYESKRRMVSWTMILPYDVTKQIGIFIKRHCVKRKDDFIHNSDEKDAIDKKFNKLFSKSEGDKIINLYIRALLNPSNTPDIKCPGVQYIAVYIDRNGFSDNPIFTGSRAVVFLALLHKKKTEDTRVLELEVYEALLREYTSLLENGNLESTTYIVSKIRSSIKKCGLDSNLKISGNSKSGWSLYWSGDTIINCDKSIFFLHRALPDDFCAPMGII